MCLDLRIKVPTLSDRAKWNLSAWLLILGWYHPHEVIEILGPRPDA